MLGEHVNVFHEWLHPVFARGIELTHAHGHELSHSAEWMLIAVSVIAALSGIFIAWMMYIRKKVLAKSDAEQAGIELVLFRKYFVDELYSYTVIRPLIDFCRWAWSIFDAGVIDKVIVLGSARSVYWIGGGIRKVQTGVLGTYALMLAGGIIILLFLFIVR